jgi:hypothetical protein
MRRKTLVELLAREHRTVEGLLAELKALDANELHPELELLGVLQSYAQMSKSALVAALRGHAR